MIEPITRVAGGLVEALRHHPLALVLVVVNGLFIAGAGYGLKHIGEAGARRDAILADLAARDCAVMPKGDRLPSPNQGKTSP